ALVLRRESIDGFCWQIEKNELLHRIVVIGDNLSILIPSSVRVSDNRDETYASKPQRQIMAFGEAGQKLIKQMNVAIVGLGGIGSQVIQQLAYLGVRNFVIVDFDNIGKNSLNR